MVFSCGPAGVAMTATPAGAVLAAQPEPLDQGAVAADVHLLQVAQQPAPTADQAHQAAAGVVVVLVLLEVLGQVRDPLGQHRHLRLGRTGVALVQAVLGENFLLLLGGQRHVWCSYWYLSRAWPAPDYLRRGDDGAGRHGLQPDPFDQSISADGGPGPSTPESGRPARHGDGRGCLMNAATPMSSPTVSATMTHRTTSTSTHDPGGGEPGKKL